MKKLLFLILILGQVISAYSKTTEKRALTQVSKLTIKKDSLMDKIKGGWAGQTIGVTFGGPYEFKFRGTFIGDYQPLVWQDDFLKKYMSGWPGLYDDLYMDLTFVDVFEKYGLDAPVDSFANAFAHAGYMLWHANQAARYNILNGVKAPQSGYWLNNPHADDIDYQIEADFAGLMSPGMPNAASAISDKIGHIMNYGDGWYGGIFVGAMYSIAFTTKNVNDIVTEAIKTVPEQSEFYQCINDVINWHKKYPDNWEQTWFETQKKWGNDVGCPEGVFNPYNIDAKINSAYVVIGLLYGQGDYTKSLEITTRCGQDADCNPSTVGGILGTMYGYSHIPEYWKRCLKDAEDMDFKYTTMSLNDVYGISYKHALENIEKNGGEVTDNNVIIPFQKPIAVRFEKGFDGHFPVAKMALDMSGNNDEIQFDFEGIGFVLSGEVSIKNASGSTYIFNTELFVDGKLVESPKWPVNYTTRRTDLCWKYQMPEGKHSIRIKILNPVAEGRVNSIEATIYANRSVKN